MLAEALAIAIRDGDSENEAKLCVSLGRSVVAFRWSANPCLPGILAYANVRSDSDDDFLAPAFILTSMVNRISLIRCNWWRGFPTMSARCWPMPEGAVLGNAYGSCPVRMICSSP